MAKKRPQNTAPPKSTFFFYFWFTTGLLFAVKILFPGITGNQGDDVIPSDPSAVTEHTYTPDQPENTAPDSIATAAQRVDALFECPHAPIRYTDVNGRPLKKGERELDYAVVFNDSNHLHLATAEHIGQPSCQDRKEAAEHRNMYVYIGASPYYDVENLTHSVPYLVPRAATLLDEIGHAFLDSLTRKGIPFHKMVVTSVLRTEEDVERLKQTNGNVSDNSCHRYGTTFDIAYNTFYRVMDPDGPKRREWSASELLPVLAEVLDDQHRLGTCYVKYEVKEHCFHITCR